MSSGASDWEGQTLLDPSGEKIGTIDEVYLVEETGRPEWALVSVAGLGRRTTLAPLAGARPVQQGIRSAYEKSVVKEAPPVEKDVEPSEQQVVAVYRHYGIDPDADPSRSQPPPSPSARSRTGGASDGRRHEPDTARTGSATLKSTKPVPEQGSGGGGTLKRVAKEFSDDNLTHWAAALTYYGVLSIFPALLAMVAILGLIGSSAIQPLIDNLGAVAPGPAKDILTSALEGAQQGSGAGVLFFIALFGAIWSASGYISGFMDASNAIYDIEEGRPIWKKLPLRLAITVVMLLLLTASALAVVLTGPVAEQAGNLFGIGSSAVALWDIAKWPVLALIVAFMFAVLYYAAPNVKQPGLKSVLPGGAVAVLLWLVVSAAFAFYVASFASYNKTYGALGGVIVFLVWLWLTNLAILLGAEFNAERARQRHIDSGHRADDEPYLAPRSGP